MVFFLWTQPTTSIPCEMLSEVAVAWTYYLLKPLSVLTMVLEVHLVDTFVIGSLV